MYLRHRQIIPTVPQIVEKDSNVTANWVGTIQTSRKLQKWTANYPNGICGIGTLFQTVPQIVEMDSNVTANWVGTIQTSRKLQKRMANYPM